ncbi:MAG: hypothetical protein ACR2FH_06480, partial [Caulobacteraceae bacterium]
SLTRHLTGAGFGFTEQRPILARFPLFEVAMAMSSLGAVLLTAAALARGRARITGVWTGLMIAALTIGAAIQLLAPTVAFIVAWPVIAAAALSALTAVGAARGRVAWVLGLVIVTLTLGWLGGFFHALLQGLDLPEAPAAIAWLAALVLWPLAWPAPPARRPFAPGAAALLAGLAIAMFMQASSPWSVRHPRAAEPLYVVNPASGKAWRASAVEAGPWSRAVLTADGGTIGALRVPGLPAPVAAAPATPVPIASPAIEVHRGADGAIVLHAPLGAGVSTLRLDLLCDTLVTGTVVNGKPTPILNTPGRWTHLRWQAAPEGFTLVFQPVGPGILRMRWAEYLAGWPSAARPLPPMPATVMGWDMAGSTVVVGARRVRL